MDMLKPRAALSHPRTRVLVLLLALLADRTPAAVQGLECILTEPPQTRTFESFSEYRTNRRPFSPIGRGFEGNEVDFAFPTLDRLVTDMFKTYDSKHIVKLNLTRKGIQRIDTAAFSGLSCLHVLDLSRNNITAMGEGTFRDLGRLRRLDLSGNRLTGVSPGSLVHLESLEVLNLAGNSISAVPDPVSFFNLSTLTVLYLSGNGMKQWPEGLDLLTHLKELRVASNKLNSLALWQLANVSDTLEVLDVGSNDIASINFTTNGSTTFAVMKTLDISNNSLHTMDVHKLKSVFPDLKSVHIEDNSWECHVLSVVIHELDDAKITYHYKNSTGAMNLTTKNELGKIGPGLACRSGAVLYPPTAVNGSLSAGAGAVAGKGAGAEATNATLLRLAEVQAQTGRNWTGLGLALRELMNGNAVNTRLTHDVLRELAGLQNVLVLFGVVVALCMVARVCVRAGACQRCADYDRICGRNHDEFYIDHDRDGDRRRARRSHRARESRGLLHGAARCTAYRAV